MQTIDPAEYEKRLARLGELLSGMVRHADVQAQTRCPYKNRFDQCTALFGCRYQRKSIVEGELAACTSDDRLDYRSAWETNPEAFDAMRQKLRGAAGVPQPQPVMGIVACGENRCAATAGATLFDHADVLSVRVPTSCGRSGTCHECIVEVRSGAEALSPPTPAESFLKKPFRLACQARIERPESDVELALLSRAPQILTLQTRREPALDPLVTRQGNAVFYDGQEIDAYRGRMLGLSLDVGTTTIVAELLDLETGRPLAAAAMENPQRFGGSDVMSRISYDAGRYQGELHQAIIHAINAEIRGLCAQAGVSRHTIYEILVVGNATMRDLFFGLDVQPIGQKPYKSNVELEYLAGRRTGTSLLRLARELGLHAAAQARVFGAPLVASHVGGDVAADLAAIDIESHDDVVMLVDAGTNTEVVIGHKGRLMAASCPAGPAFEGGLVTCGMTGCEGAIERLRYVDGRFEYQTIGGGPPLGICGSGLIDLVAELRRNGMMTAKGVFADKATVLQIVPEHGITFSRADASHLAQAKAANYCGQILLMRRFGISPEKISRLYLAGGFANYVDSAHAIEIGFLAPIAPERIEKVGNASAQGAREMLLSRTCRERIERLVQSIEHVELETMGDFFEMFVEGCMWERMKAEG